MIDQPKKQQKVLDPNKTKTIGNYVLGKTIGKGTFGKVKLATHILTGQKVAVKILEKQRIIDVADVQRVNRQIHILKLIRHPGIIQLYDIIQTPKHLFLIMEYMQGGQLFDYIVKCKKIPQDQACIIFQQIIAGVEYIHKLNIVHRDLKPQNLLIDYDKSIRIVDFGLSNIYRKQQRLKTACGSPCYAAPQMIEGKNKYQPIMVDIWSCGVILYAMLCGCLPFQDPQTSKLYQKILSGEYKTPKSLSNDAKDLVSKILTVDPTKRYTIQDIRNHKWWKLSSVENNCSVGIIIGYNKIPVEQCILDEVVKLGFQPDFTKKCIESNRHNNTTTSYYLLLKKFVKNGGISTASLNSKYFDPNLILPAKKMRLTGISYLNTAPSLLENVYKNQSSPVQTSKTIQTTLMRRNYMMHKHKAEKLKKQQNSKSKISNGEVYMMEDKYRLTNRRGRSLNSKSKIESIKANTNIYQLSNNISNKYRETYGVSLISKSKQRSRNKSLKKQQPYMNYGNLQQKLPFHFNQTIDYHRNYKNRSYKLGADLGYINKSIEHDANRTYMRKVIYH